MSRSIWYPSPIWCDVAFTENDLRVKPEGAVTAVYAGGIEALKFPGNKDSSVHGTLSLPLGFCANSDVYPQVRFEPDDAVVAETLWGLEYTWVQCGSPSLPPTTITATMDTCGVAKQAQLLSLPVISGSGRQCGASMRFRFFRNGDSYNGDCWLVFLRFCMRKSRAGKVCIPLD